MNTIESVSILSVGEAKGHGLFIDQQTLEEVKACAETYKGGVKVNLDHGAGIKDIVGFVNNFRIEDDRLIGDLNLLETSPMKSYVLEIAEKLPDTFGISISFSGPVREVDGQEFASCTELYSADLVQTPAANPTGLFSFEAKRVDSSADSMEDQNTTDENAEEVKKDPSEEMAERLSALESAFAELMKKYEEAPAAEDEEAPAAEAEDEEMGCKCGMSRFESKLDAIIKNFGANPIKASARAETPKQEALDLKAVIVAKTTELGSRTAAIKFAMSNHPAEYVTLRDSNQLNF